MFSPQRERKLELSDSPVSWRLNRFLVRVVKPSVSEQSEEVAGVIAAVAKLALGSERLNLYVTNRRIIVAHIGKRGAGAVAGMTFFGRLGGALEDLLKSGKESRGKRRLELSSPSDILAADKDNFAIAYEDIVQVDVDEAPRLVGLTILSKDEKLEFVTRLGFETVLGLLSGRLGSKLAARKFFG